MKEYKSLGNWFWDDENESTIPWNKFCNAVVDFHDKCYKPMMQRKTYTSHDVHFFECMKIMMENLEMHFDEMRYKD